MKKEIINFIVGILALLFIFGLFNVKFLYLFIILLIALMIIIFMYRRSKINNNNNKPTTLPSQKNGDFYYEIKPYLTPSEYVFYHKLKSINTEWIIIPQVPLSAIIKKVNGRGHNELSRILDFCIFDKNFNLLLAIELNDSSHNKINRIDRDLKVRKILNDCYIKLLTFYTKYPNEQDYVSKRIIEAIKYEI